VEVYLRVGLRVGTLEVGRELMAQLLPGGQRCLRQVHESQRGHAGQGHRKVVDHDSLILSCSEDGGVVDLQELDRVDGPIVLLQQVGPELARPDYHAEVRRECHAPTHTPWRARGVRSTCHRSSDRSTIVTLEVAMPLAVALDGDGAVLTQASALEVGPKVYRSDAHRQHMQRGWHACR
jgi:hypothetical protein